MPAIHPEKIYAPLARKHALSHKDWIERAATDFWLLPGPGALTATTGFTLTTLTATTGSAADLLSAADVGTIAAIETSALNSLFLSPSLFADYKGALVAQKLMGSRLPTKFIMEIYGGFTTNANELMSGFGLKVAGSAGTATADNLAFVCTNNTNFVLSSGSGASNAAITSTLAVDTVPHLFRVVLSAVDQAIYFYIDGTKYGTSIPISATGAGGDIYPALFAMFASTTARPRIGFAHLWYDF